MKPSLCIFGGALIDRIGTFETPFHIGQSHPGRWQNTIGGVAANVARHVSRFGGEVKFASVFAPDHDARLVQAQLRSDGLNLMPNNVIPGGVTPSYTVMHDTEGNVVAGLADMALHDHMDISWAKAAAAFGQTSDMWIADTNIGSDALKQLADLKRDIPLYVVAVSPAKIIVLEHLLPTLDGLICNKMEAEALLKSEHPNAASAASALISAGVPHCIVSNGAEACASAKSVPGENTCSVVERAPIQSMNNSADKHLTGVGDAFAATCLFALCVDDQISQTDLLKHANAAARLAMADADTCPDLNWHDVVKTTTES